MNFSHKLKLRVINGYEVTKEDALLLANEDLESLCSAANQLRIHFCGNAFDICAIINGKSGRCSEDCKYCAQSSYYNTQSAEYPLMEKEAIQTDAKRNAQSGILRYSVVTSGRSLSDQELDNVCKSYGSIVEEKINISLCASHGLLTFEQFVKLKDAGVTRYHNNLETSRRFFPQVCTTHSYDDKVSAIKSAQMAGLEVCSGGIMGLGETMEDRIDMALDLRFLGIQSVPINILNPIKDTPFEHLTLLTADEVRRIAAIFRFILPQSFIRLAGGRGLLADKGRSIFMSGANAAISGDMLTTSGISVHDDLKMLEELGFQVRKI